jgi:hypothetical protein
MENVTLFKRTRHTGPPACPADSFGSKEQRRRRRSSCEIVATMQTTEPIAKPEMLYPGAETFESARPQGAATLIDTRQDTPSLVLP